MKLFAGDVPGPQPAGGTASAGDTLASVAVLIPAWQPDHRLVLLVKALHQHGFRRILVIDDGSTTDRQPIFRDLQATIPGLEVCRHFTNQGKGKALKSGFHFVLTHFPEITAVITADGDGQHLPGDILRLAHQLRTPPPRAILGVRDFRGCVPLRSRFGNAIARRLFTLLTGHSVLDTQTGLRGLPASFLPELLALPGERYEYETVMLAHLCQVSGVPHQMPIDTVYLEGNRGSHFRPVWDSLRVYLALFRLWRPFTPRSRPALDHRAERPLRTA